MDAEAARRFERDGFFVESGLLESAVCESLCARSTERIIEAAGRHLSGELPLDFWALLPRSADDVLAFWDLSRGSPQALPKERWEPYAMRLGHALHKRDDVFRVVCEGRALVERFRALAHGPIKLVQSALIDKQPRSEAVQFGLHQDSWYLTTEPESLVLAFIALDDMDPENGCLEVVPGSHRLPLATTFRLAPSGFVAVDGRALSRPPTGAVPIPLARGDALFLGGRTYHGSAPNRSTRRRRALIVHAMRATSRLAASSWVQEPAGGFEIY